MAEFFMRIFDEDETRLLKETRVIPNAGLVEERIVITTCTLDCGGKCPLNVHVKNGAIEKITMWTDGQLPPLKACIRGLNYHHKVYSPDRLKYPLVRVGERGEGRFRRISWNEAWKIIAKEMKKVRDTYGPEAIFECTYTGSSQCMLHRTNFGPLYRCLNAFGGRTAFGTKTSNEGAYFASRFTFGTKSGVDSNSFADLVNSKLIILWGFNPVVTVHGTSTVWYLKQAKKRGIKMICIDPCYNDTAKVFANEWIPIRPSTDVAMMIAMAYVLITEHLYDQDFIETYTYGFEFYKDYVLGVRDGLPKTPDWAEEICGVPAATITRLAREYARTKPATIIQGKAIGRCSNGEQSHKAGIVLAAMIGNIGIQGGSGGSNGQQFKNGFKKKMSRDSYSADSLLLESSKLVFGGKGVEIKVSTWADAVLKGRKGGYPSDIKMIYVSGHNILNQRQNVKKSIKAFKAVEFVVVQEQFLTPTARYADILLPANTNFERNDIASPWNKGNYVIFAKKVIDSLYDTKSELGMAYELADRLDVKMEFKSEDAWLRHFFENSEIKNSISYEEFKKKGVFRLPKGDEEHPGEPFIAFRKQIEDTEQNPFPTPTGKLEIYSKQLELMDFDVDDYSEVVAGYRNVPKIPMYVECEELPGSSRSKMYPLQLVNAHHKYRVHSQLANIPKLRKLYRSEIWINPVDAKVRGIKQDDVVRVHNDTGAIRVYAKVTNRIMPGVVRCHEGAWFDFDEEGVDNGGCTNTLISDKFATAGGSSNFNTCLVEIRKEPEEIAERYRQIEERSRRRW